METEDDSLGDSVLLRIILWVANLALFCWCIGIILLPIILVTLAVMYSIKFLDGFVI